MPSRHKPSLKLPYPSKVGTPCSSPRSFSWSGHLPEGKWPILAIDFLEGRNRCWGEERRPPFPFLAGEVDLLVSVDLVLDAFPQHWRVPGTNTVPFANRVQRALGHPHLARRNSQRNLHCNCNAAAHGELAALTARLGGYLGTRPSFCGVCGLGLGW